MYGQESQSLDFGWWGPLFWVVVFVMSVIYLIYEIVKLIICIFVMTILLSVTYVCIKFKFPQIYHAFCEQLDNLEKAGRVLVELAKSFLPLLTWFCVNIRNKFRASRSDEHQLTEMGPKIIPRKKDDSGSSENNGEGPSTASGSPRISIGQTDDYADASSSSSTNFQNGHGPELSEETEFNQQQKEDFSSSSGKNPSEQTSDKTEHGFRSNKTRHSGEGSGSESEIFNENKEDLGSSGENGENPSNDSNNKTDNSQNGKDSESQLYEQTTEDSEISNNGDKSPSPSQISDKAAHDSSPSSNRSQNGIGNLETDQ